MNEHELRILHVDDDEEDRTFFAEALQKANLPHQVIGANSCMGMLKLMEEGNTYDLIVLDVNMPVIDGRQCLTKIKSHEKFRDVPVVIFTISSSQQDIDEVYKSGGHGYVVKPYSSLNFVLAVKKIFERDWKSKPPVHSKEDFVINFAFIQV